MTQGKVKIRLLRGNFCGQGQHNFLPFRSNAVCKYISLSPELRIRCGSSPWPWSRLDSRIRQPVSSSSSPSSSPFAIYLTFILIIIISETSIIIISKAATNLIVMSSGNSLFSPISILTTINMLMLGTKGTTKSEVLQALGQSSSRIRPSPLSNSNTLSTTLPSLTLLSSSSPHSRKKAGSRDPGSRTFFGPN